MQLFICFAATLAAASAWSCPSLTPKDPFSITKFAGTWYNQYSKNTPLEMGSCLVSNYTYDSDTQIMTINSTLKTVFGFVETMSGQAVLEDPSSTEGRLVLTYYTPIKDFVFNLLVLATDYDEYVVLYSCTQLLFYPYESTWILTKDRTVSSATLKTIEAAMKKIAENGGPSFDQMKQNDQTNCS